MHLHWQNTFFCEHCGTIVLHHGTHRHNGKDTVVRDSARGDGRGDATGATKQCAARTLAACIQEQRELMNEEDDEFDDDQSSYIIDG
eukprot:scaffold227872_cov35-Attheya_sp.AAC.1